MTANCWALVFTLCFCFVVVVDVNCFVFVFLLVSPFRRKDPCSPPMKNELVFVFLNSWTVKARVVPNVISTEGSTRYLTKLEKKTVETSSPIACLNFFLKKILCDNGVAPTGRFQRRLKRLWRERFVGRRWQLFVRCRSRRQSGTSSDARGARDG